MLGPAVFCLQHTSSIEHITRTQMSDRSASPARDEPKQKKQKKGGFAWKDKKPEKADERTGGGLERGYRDRSPRRDSYRERDREKTDSYRPRDEANPPERATERSKDRPQNDVASKFNLAQDDGSARKEKKKNTPKAPVVNEPMIIVNVNDRLGTKAAIPCLASDNIKAFKAIVAAQIGRQPHEIMLKRQGERPFKDQLTLEDYGVSNGVQLDLELDTGD